MKVLKLFARIATMIAVLVLVFGAGTSNVKAYGSTALWQIGVSANCNNPSFCGSDLGGFWGWLEFDQGGLGDATLTGCSHMVAAGPVHVAGAGHISLDITSWSIGPGSAGPQSFLIHSGTMTIMGHGTPVTVPFGELDLGIPAVPGHYSTADILGFTEPGVSFQLQVVQLNH